jgi:Ser/Thr protein kinase RdoA (MazF antagonist)
MTGTASLSGLPAFTSLLPRYPARAEVPAERLAVLRDFLGWPADIHVLGAAGDTIEGRYVVRGRGDERALFLKIFPESVAALQHHSACVSAFLADRGLPVIRPLDDSPRAVVAGYAALLFPYVEARFARPSEAELRAIAEALTRMHAALREYPRARDTQRAAGLMHERLAAAAAAILARGDTGDAVQGLCFAAAQLYLAEAAELFRGAQMVHGDCNYTNMLFEVPSGSLRVIDFEESAAAWLDPWFDYGMVLQRFVLTAAEDRQDALAGAYLGACPRGGAPDLERLLLLISYRSVLILSEKAREGMVVPAAEWDKFAQLARLAKAAAPRLSRWREQWS